MNLVKQKVGYGFLLILLIAMNVFWIHRNNTLNKSKLSIEQSLKGQIAELNDQILNFSYIKEAYHGYIISSFKYANENLLDVPIVIPHSGESKMLKDILGSQPVIVYRIPMNSCDACYDDITQNVFNLLNNDQNRMIILIPIQRLNEYKSLIPKFSSVYCTTSNVNLALDSGYQPYFFTTDVSLRVDNYLNVIKDDAQLINKYLDYQSLEL